MSSDLAETFRPALERREGLIAALHGEGTDCYRLFHGVAEGRPGLTLDRYGPVLLVQTWREPATEADLSAARLAVADGLGAELAVAWRHRGGGRIPRRPVPPGLEDAEGRELGIAYDVRPHHPGQDPLLFLDLRALRRRVLAHAAGCTVLNLFAYTCGVGLCAAVAGAAEVWNVDFAAFALEVGRANACRNGVAHDGFRTVRQDVFPVLRQLAGLPVKGRARRRRFRRFEPRAFDLVVLDPPRWSKGPFGAVDTVRDYESLFKPALLATKPGGVVAATNHVPSVPLDAWLERLARCADKAGRPLDRMDVLPPEADFPSFDERPPLKIAWCRLAS